MLARRTRGIEICRTGRRRRSRISAGRNRTAFGAGTAPSEGRGATVVRLRSSAAQRLQPLRLDDLDPVAVRILDERHVFHLPLIRPLHERYLVPVEPSDRGIEIRHREADVTEALRLRIAVVV